MSDPEFVDIDFDLKDESWLQDEQESENEESTETLKIDISKVQRDLLPKTVLIDYIRERIKQTHNKRILISDEGEKALMKVVENHLRKYLDKFIYVLIELVQVSELKTIFQRHVISSERLLSGVYNSRLAGCETNETSK